MLTRQQADQIAAQMVALYVSNRDRFVLKTKASTYIPKMKGRNMFLADSNIVKHLLREYALSVYGHSEGSRFICFDVDDGGHDAVKALHLAIEAAGIDRADIHTSFSGKKGYHVELFFDDIVPQLSLLRFFRSVVSSMQIDTSKIEFRPSENTSIKLPLSMHPDTGRICWYLDQNSLQEIESYDYVHHIQPMDATGFIELANSLDDQLPDSSEAIDALFVEYQKSECLAISSTQLPPLEQVGTRHCMTVRLAVALRKQGIPMDACGEILLGWLKAQDSRLIESSSHAAFKDTWQVVKWVYNVAQVFVVNGDSQAAVSKTDMQRAMAHHAKSTRKLFFLLTFNRMYRSALRQTDMAAMLGLSIQTTQSIIQQLMKNEDVIQQHGGFKHSRKGKLCKQRSRYDIVRKPIEKAHDALWQTDLHYHAFTLPQTPDEFLAAYHGTIHAMFTATDLQRNMVPSEYAEYLRYLATRTGDTQASPDPIHIKEDYFMGAVATETRNEGRG